MGKKRRVVVYRGWKRQTPIVVTIKIVCPGVGKIDCIECKGSGWWGFGPTQTECGPCVECKGAGYVFVSC